MRPRARHALDVHGKATSDHGRPASAPADRGSVPCRGPEPGRGEAEFEELDRPT